MQKLYFESAWDKTIAPRDRQKIEMIFLEQAMYLKDGILFSFLWKAINHKDELLITVLVHNPEETTLHVQETIITYSEQDKQIATGIFSIPCGIAGKTTMPWTFIFSASSPTTHPAQYMIQN